MNTYLIIYIIICIPLAYATGRAVYAHRVVLWELEYLAEKKISVLPSYMEKEERLYKRSMKLVFILGLLSFFTVLIYVLC